MLETDPPIAFSRIARSLANELDVTVSRQGKMRSGKRPRA
jgi:hypothetical protein